jgi:hypothetical protein
MQSNLMRSDKMNAGAAVTHQAPAHLTVGALRCCLKASRIDANELAYAKRAAKEYALRWHRLDRSGISAR